MLHAVLLDELGKGHDGFILLLFAVGGIDHSGIQHLAGTVHHSHLAAHAVTGVQSHGHLTLDGRLHQQRAQVQGELADGALAGGIGQGAAGLTLQRGEQQTVIGILGGRLDKLHGPAAGDHHMTAHGAQSQIAVQFHRNFQLLFLLAPVDGQNLVALQAGEGLGKLIIQAVNRVLISGGGAGQLTLPHQQFTQLLAQVRIIADGLCNDVGGAGQSLFGGVHALFGINIVCRLRQRFGTVGFLGKEQFRQKQNQTVA